MNRTRQLTDIVAAFARRSRGNWQMYFLPAALLYAGALLHLLFFDRGGEPGPVYEALNTASFLLALAAAAVIFNLKRKYFSRRFVRREIEAALRRDPARDSEALLGDILQILRGKMHIVWMLGLIIVADGVLVYALTAGNLNMNIYCIVGLYSLVINYPRKDLFMDMPWFVVEEKKFYQQDQ